MRNIVVIVLLVSFLSPNAGADDTVAEIDYLLNSIGSSQCTFIRNGKRYSAEDAETHLRSKYRRGKRYALTSENFIARLASKSSVSNKPYYLECDGEDKMPSGDWLIIRLGEYRAGSHKLTHTATPVPQLKTRT